MKAGEASGAKVVGCGGAERPSATAIPDVAPMMISSTITNCHNTRRADLPMARLPSCGMTQRRCMSPMPPSTRTAAVLARISCP